MNYRILGQTGLKVSELGFGCGSVGGLIVRGEHRTAVQAVARAIELGINYFDTAAAYGHGQSETNLGTVLAELGANVLVGTKVMLSHADLDNVQNAIVTSVEVSLKRLRRDYADIVYLHNPIEMRRQVTRTVVTIPDVQAAIDAFHLLRERGLIHFWGINGLGETEALHEAVRSVKAHAIQVCYNLLNPTAGMAARPEFPFQDFRQLMDRAAQKGMGIVAIRVLAGGALSGTAERHPLAEQALAPIASGQDYPDDVRRAALFKFLAEDGYAGSLVEAALRFAVSHAQISTTLVGLSSLEQLEQAAQAVARGPLPQDALDRIAQAMTRTDIA